MAKRVLSTASSHICAELVKDFLEHYKLDYTLSIYLPEANLNSREIMKKDELVQKCGLNEADSTKPVL